MSESALPSLELAEVSRSVPLPALLVLVAASAMTAAEGGEGAVSISLGQDDRDEETTWYCARSPSTHCRIGGGGDGEGDSCFGLVNCGHFRNMNSFHKSIGDLITKRSGTRLVLQFAFLSLRRGFEI